MADGCGGNRAESRTPRAALPRRIGNPPEPDKVRKSIEPLTNCRRTSSIASRSAVHQCARREATAPDRPATGIAPIRRGIRRDMQQALPPAKGTGKDHPKKASPYDTL